MSEPARLLRHVVLFKFRDDTPPEQVKAIETAFCALPRQIDAIHDFEWGTDVSVEGIARGYSHCFLVTFKSEVDRDAYLPHPAHRAFGDLLRPYKEQVLVLDYWAQV
ncbi:MAG: stress responsive protein [Chloroflexi bacterium]|nr:MAG: stress responsive protein [Chloroflexota bacterium]